MKVIYIDSEYITLGQLLKMTNIINSGGMVKFFLNENKVIIDNVLENRRGRKLYPDMVIDVKNYGVFKIGKK